ncbi:neck protein [uncultured Caudovirales phage]|uniref:Neck protein n=1 Tax=uncultured Caudovirales phage TaxID=2100421 RepID=A0A6J5M7S4_9CAUD|nr:neck protein [uncultured Caudovirales phage]
MASNKYFNLYNQRQEQSLLQDLVEESIKIHAIDAVYIPRTNDKIDPLFREDPLAQFDDYHHIEVYIKNVDGFEGDGNIFRKFGLDIRNQITFSMSRASFAKTFGKEMSRPKEGDLIYLPMSLATALFEIRFVAEESVFYNLGEFYVFDLQCEQFAFQDENVSTGIKDLDDSVATGSQNLLLNLSTNIGTFSEGEYIYQGESLFSAKARAKFVEYISTTEIKIKDLYGEFTTSNGVITGASSSAQATLASNVDLFDIQEDFGAKNKNFVVLDFTESNPFSEDE